MSDFESFWTETVTHCCREGRMPQSSTKSLHSALSPAMFPSAHTAYDTTTLTTLNANLREHSKRVSRGAHLLLDVLVLRVEQFDENGHSSGLNHHFSVKEGPGGDVGQRPGRLELERENI